MFHLSLDIVLGAVGAYAVAAMGYGEPFQWLPALALGAGVWLIYTFDHLVDARAFEPNQGERHEFHRTHRRWLWPLFAAVAVGELVLLWWLPWQLVLGGVALASLVGIYFVVLHVAGRLLSYSREALVGLIYAFGVTLPLWVGGDVLPLMGTLVYFCLAFLNMLLFSLFEKDPGRPSLRSGLGNEGVLVAIVGLGLVCLAAAGDMLVAGARTVGLAPLLILGVYAAVLVWPRWFGQRERYRYAIDGAFLLFWVGSL